MNVYRWELRKGSKKEICPACGKRRFVPYVSAIDGKTLAGPEYGRCDREQNCGYIRYPDTDAHADVQPQPRQVLHPLRFAQAAIDVQPSALYDYAKDLLTEVDALMAWMTYKVGAVGDRTIFWQIDEQGEIRAGKAIRYKTDGHRDKNAMPPVQWCHKMAAFDGLHTGEELQQCFFGQHLLKEKGRNVAIVESEKTALCMSRIEPRYIWLACGGSQLLKNDERHRVLQGYKVTLFPDHGQFFNWQRTAQKYGYEISDYMETHPLFDGCDILDYYDYSNRKQNEKDNFY